MTTIEDVPHVAPPEYIAPPEPEPTRFGLLSVANVVDSPGLRWEVGIEWEPLPSDPAGIVSTICRTQPGEVLDAIREDGESLAAALPFGVYGSYDCSVFSRPLDEAENRARQHLAITEERAAERAIAAGQWDNLPTFQGAEVLLGGEPVDVTRGLGALEAHAAANYGGSAVIHAPSGLSARLSQHGVVARFGQRIETLVGNYVALGGGYELADVGPDGAPAPDGNAWVYATGRPTVRRSNVEVYPAEDQRPTRRQNDVTIVAMRVYLVAWSGAPAAVLVER